MRRKIRLFRGDSLGIRHNIRHIVLLLAIWNIPVFLGFLGPEVSFSELKAFVFSGEGEPSLSQKTALMTDEWNALDLAGFTVPSWDDDGYWIRMDIPRKFLDHDLVLSTPVVSVGLFRYEIYRGGQLIERAGIAEIERVREQSGHHLFSIPISGHKADISIVLKVNNIVSLTPLFRVHRAENFEIYHSVRVFLLAIHLGALLTLILYNGFILVSVKERSYFFYVAYLTTVVFATLADTGLISFSQLIFKVPILDLYGFSTRIESVALFSMLITIPLFLYEFNPLPEKQAFFRPWTLGFVALTLMFGVVSLFLPAMTAKTLALVLFFFGIVVLALVSLPHISRVPVIFAGAWGILVAGALVSRWSVLGVFPHNTFSDWMIYFTTIVEALMLSYALAERIKQNTSFKANLQMGMTAQQALLPSLDHSIPSLQISQYYRNAEELGGDWFYVRRDEQTDRVYIIVTDVTGHGLSSALLTGITAGAFNQSVTQLANHWVTQTIEDQALFISQGLKMSLFEMCESSQKYITASLCVLDLKTNRGCNLSMGHPPIYLKSSGYLSALASSSSPIGLEPIDRASWVRNPVVSFKFESGDSLFLYTDGLFENRGPTGRCIKKRSIKKILNESSDSHDAKTKILREIDEVCGGQSPEDDCTFLIIDKVTAA